MKRLLIKGLAFSLALAIWSLPAAYGAPSVAKIYDGDTITLNNGDKVRFLQIDTPELASGECYAVEARSALVKILNGPGALKISTDPKLDKTDRYGRLLRYVFKGNINVNLKLVEIGAASPYFYRGELGIYSSKLLASAKNAKAKSLGLWSKCPGTVLDPVNAITTQSSIAYPKNAPGVSSICDANYQGCVPQFPPDLDCPDIKRLGLAPVRVIGKDVHKLDRDGDGIGCDK